MSRILHAYESFDKKFGELMRVDTERYAAWKQQVGERARMNGSWSRRCVRCSA